MDKRDFIKTGVAGFIGFLTLPTLAGNLAKDKISPRYFKFPKLAFNYSDLEPWMDAVSLQNHYEILHKSYAENLNNALAENNLTPKFLYNIFEDPQTYSPYILHNSGGFYNHRLFWKSLSPMGGGNPSAKLMHIIDRDFGSLRNFKNEFNRVAQNQIDEGWVWAIMQQGHLKITASNNEENPMMYTFDSPQRGTPVLCIDLWAHAYQNKYGDRKDLYTKAFWEIINWENFEARIDWALSG